MWSRFPHSAEADPRTWVARHGLPPGGALLDAAGPPLDTARFSALCLEPVERLSWRLGDPGAPLERLEAFAGPPAGVDTDATLGPRPAVVCALGYDLGRALGCIPDAARAPGPLPDLWAARYEAAWVWDRQAREGWIVAAHPAAARRLRARLGAGGATPPPLRCGPVAAHTPRAQYDAVIAQVLEHIRAGDIYQANLTVRFSGALEGGDAARDPSPLFDALHRRSPVPWAALLRLDAGRAVLSISPERFLRWRPDGAVETRPIKGTRPRGADPRADAALAEALLGSEKDRAEHVMIVDLERNDLGRVCRIGSVEVPALFELESYETVHHLVSRVTGRLREDVGLAALLSATFPGGSITGAPKLRAMEIIDALEPVERGIYCGAVGYLDADGGGDLNLAIRTAWIAEGRLFYQAGGGIVADSTAADEWEELQLKARAFLQAL